MRLSHCRVFAAGIPVLQRPRSPRRRLVATLRFHRCRDLFCGDRLQMMLEVVWPCPLGTFNLHALPPRYRCRAHQSWAASYGETETGVTTFFLSHDIDTGPIIARR